MHAVNNGLQAQLAVSTTRGIQVGLWERTPVCVHSMAHAAALGIIEIRGHRTAVAAGADGPASVEAIDIVAKRQQLLGLARGRRQQLALVHTATKRKIVVAAAEGASGGRNIGN